MKLRIAILCVSCALAQGPPSDGFVHWPAGKLKGYPAALTAKAAAGKKGAAASEQLLNRGNHTFMVIRRDQSGEPEVHANWTDVFIAQDGEGTLTYGGKVEGGRETQPGETRGGKIVGGSSQKVVAGDMAVIPAGMPHLTSVENGKSFTYMVIKVEKK